MNDTNNIIQKFVNFLQTIGLQVIIIKISSLIIYFVFLFRVVLWSMFL